MYFQPINVHIPLYEAYCLYFCHHVDVEPGTKQRLEHLYLVTLLLVVEVFIRRTYHHRVVELPQFLHLAVLRTTSEVHHRALAYPLLKLTPRRSQPYFVMFFVVYLLSLAYACKSARRFLVLLHARHCLP